jgi:hypothetical protein
MLTRMLVKTTDVEAEGHAYFVKYYESTTANGTRRYSAELALGPADRIILDAGSLAALESRVARLVPATLHSRILAARTAAA